jgi:hypothetical protein
VKLLHYRCLVAAGQGAVNFQFIFIFSPRKSNIAKTTLICLSAYIPMSAEYRIDVVWYPAL